MSIQSNYIQSSSTLRFPRGSAARISAKAALPPKTKVPAEQQTDSEETRKGLVRADRCLDRRYTTQRIPTTSSQRPPSLHSLPHLPPSPLPITYLSSSVRRHE